MANVEGVILAAGLSTRAGRFKMEWRLGDKTLIERAVAGMSPAVDRIIVVGGFQVERIRAILEGAPKVEVVYNEGYASGMFSSVKVGLTHVRAERVFLLPGDHPLVGEGVYRTMLGVIGDVAPTAPPDCVIPVFAGRKGHPVLMSSRAIDQILQAPDSSTLRDVIQRFGYETVEIADEGIVLDVDDPDSYQAVRQAYEHENQ
jgi:molybdenum cofactor cytidylyltransferase